MKCVPCNNEMDKVVDGNVTTWTCSKCGRTVVEEIVTHDNV